MISRTAEYALRTIVWIASRGDAPQTTRAIADATKIPAGYLAKVMQSLVRAKLVNSQRGLHGGFTLARDPLTITPLDVINAIDPIPRLDGCPLGIPAHGSQLCPLHRKLDDAMAHIEEAMGSTPIVDLIDRSAGASPLCLGTTATPKP